MYLRCSDVRDASAIYLEMKKLRPEFAVEFVDPSIFKSVSFSNPLTTPPQYQGKLTCHRLQAQLVMDTLFMRAKLS